MPSLSAPVYSIPIKSRPPPTVRLRLRALLFNAFFFTFAIVIHTCQLVILPLALLPGAESGRAFRSASAFLKDGFGAVLRAVNTFFGRSRFVLSSDGSVDWKKVVRRDGRGRLVGLEWERRSGE